MKYGVIYMHRNKINNKVYIGQTTQKPEYRWNHGFGYKDSSLFFASIQKYGWDNFEHTILEKDIPENKLDEISGYDLVITDCLHGMLFCAITGTPCIAVDQISHKVRGEYKWISELPFIYFAERIDDISDILLDKLVNSDKTKRFH